MGRIIGYVLRDVRTLEYRATDPTDLPVLSPDITLAHRYLTADEAHAAKREYQQVIELIAIDPPPLTRAQRIGRAASYFVMTFGLALVALGIWRLLT